MSRVAFPAVRATRDTTGKLPPLPGIFPDQLAPVVFTTEDGAPELAIMHCGTPCPPQ